MKRLLLLSIFLFTLKILNAQRKYDTFYDSFLKFSFKYPAVWDVKISLEPAFYMVCVPATKAEMDKYADCFDSTVFYMQVFNASLDSALIQEGYTKLGNEYLAHDRFSDSVKTFKMSSASWRGIYHNNICGVSCKENGFHAGAGTCQFLYFSNGAQTVCIQTVGRAFDDDVFKEIRTTFRFF